jgi:hypothetical protein
LLLYSSKPSLGVFQLAGHLLHIPTSTWHRSFYRRCRVLKKKLSHQYHHAINKFSGTVAREERRLLQGEFRTHILYFVLSFAFTLFLLASFYQKPKKISILDSCFYLSAFSLLEWLLLKTPSCVTLLA